MRKNVLFPLLLLGVSFVEIQAQDFYFQEISNGLNTAGIKNSAIAFADIDGDNDLDYIMTGSIPGEYTTELYKNDGFGNYSLVPNTPFKGVRFSSVGFADVDGDNDLDFLMMGCAYDGSLFGPRTTELFLNDGSGNFSLLEEAPFTQVFWGDLAFADVDGDDDMDVMIAGRDETNASSNEFFLNDGSGNFTLVEDTPFQATRYGTIDFADIDGDADMDVMITGRNDSGVYISELFLNDGSGNFSLLETDLFEGVEDSSVDFADIDGDDDLDMVLIGRSNENTSTTQLFINDGAGGYSLDADAPFSGAYYGHVAFVDYDNDEDQDVMIIGYNNTESVKLSRLYTNDGTGNYSLVPDTPFEVSYSGTFAFADIDGDNDQDLMLNGLGEDSNRFNQLYINESGVYSENISTLFDPVMYGTVNALDIDGDNDEDLFITGYNNEGTSVSELYRNYGGGYYVPVSDTPFEGIYSGAVAVADINGDNDLDVLLTGDGASGSRISKLYSNDGTGNYNLVLETPFPGVEYGAVAFADVDGDNDQDVMLTGFNNAGNPICELYSNNGSGSYSLVPDTPFEAVYHSAIAFTDIDGDNDQDVIITGKNSTNIPKSLLYTNDGSGNFSLVPDTPFNDVYAGAVAFADVDGDNDQDLIIAGKISSSTNSCKLYHNDGTGVYESGLNLAQGVEYPSLSFADVDQDGDQDLLITGKNNSYQGISELYTNNGAGSFTNVEGMPFENVHNGAAIFLDADGDGFSDVFISGKKNFSTYTAKWYRNIPHLGHNYYVVEFGNGTQDGSSIENAAPNVAAVIDNVFIRDSVKLFSGNIIESETIHIPSGITVHVNDDVSWDLQNYDISNYGHLTLEARASLIQGNTGFVNGTGSGEVIRQAGIATDKFNLLSSPIENINVQAVYGGSNVVAFNPEMYDNGLNGWEYITNGTLENGKGYAVSGSVIPNATGKHHYIGRINSGNLSIIIDGENHGGPADGWNLIGNPYPSSIGLNEFIVGNYAIGAVTLYDQLEDMYVTYNTLNAVDTDIASGQGFFVEYSTANFALVSFESSMRQSGSGAIQKTAAIVSSTIGISNNSGKSYQSMIAFGDFATDGFDLDYDARLIPGANQLTVYSLWNNEAFAIQAQATFEGEKRVAIGVESPAGENTIALLEQKNFPEGTTVFLVDNQLGLTHNLSEESYHFVVSEANKQDNRFELLYRLNSLTVNNTIAQPEVVVLHDEIVFTENISIGELRLFDILGHQLQEWKGDSQQRRFSLYREQLAAGVYVIEFTYQGKAYSKKIQILD